MPNYDFYQYPFAWPAISTSATATQTNDNTFDTYSTFTVSTNSSSIAVLLDTQYTITCYDGVAPPSNQPQSLSSNTGPLAPFNSGPSNSGIPLSTFFPSTSPNFALLRVPLFVYLGDNASKVTSQTYLQAGSSSTIGSTNIDPLNTMIFTVAYTPQGRFLGASARNENNGNYAPNLESMFDLVSETDSDISLHSCGFVSSSQRKVKNRLIASFSKTAAVGSSVFTVPITNGPDCGTTVSDMGQNRAKECLSGSTDSFWKRIA
jgi:hypothetical protein